MYWLQGCVYGFRASDDLLKYVTVFSHLEHWANSSLPATSTRFRGTQTSSQGKDSTWRDKSLFSLEKDQRHRRVTMSLETRTVDTLSFPDGFGKRQSFIDIVNSVSCLMFLIESIDTNFYWKPYFIKTGRDRKSLFHRKFIFFQTKDLSS